MRKSMSTEAFLLFLFFEVLAVKKENSKKFLFILLGMLTAFGPFVTDMYLPTLPSMTGDFQTSASMVQLGLTFSMLGLALGQLLFGPLSDKLGRRPPLIAAMGLYLVSTLACLLAPTIEIFVALRLLQGFAGAGGIVISRSIAADLFSGRELVKALAIVGAINGLAPVVAPVVGGSLAGLIGWRGIFGVLFGLGAVLTLACLNFRESLDKAQRARGHLQVAFAAFGKVIQNRRYLFYVLQLAAAQGILFGYIAASPFIIQQHYGFSPFAFSLVFALNALAIGGGAALSARFRRLENCVALSCAGMLVGSALMAGVLLVGASIAWFEGVLFATLLMMGMSFTASTALAMDTARAQAGTASALLGAGCFLVGSLVSPIVGLGDILTPTALTFVVCALLSSLFALLARREKKRVDASNSPASDQRAARADGNSTTAEALAR